MDHKIREYQKLLNGRKPADRLAGLERLMSAHRANGYRPGQQEHYVNNHIHTTCSFSPYSPAMAVWMAYCAGLYTAGIMDHDTLCGAAEFVQAGAVTGVAVTTGVECRADFSATPLAGRRINNPDQDTIGYMAIHGVPAARVEQVNTFFAPYRAERNQRNRLMTDRLNELLYPQGLCLDFDRDILSLSCYQEGGTVTERHILFALAEKLISRYTPGSQLAAFLEQEWRIPLSPASRELLLETVNPFYAYEVLNVLKAQLVGRFYIEAGAECPPVQEVLALSEEVGAVSAYAYLGDVTQSVTGDKRPQLFEDSYLEELGSVLRNLGFRAVTYMPTRNTSRQLKRVQQLCSRYGFFQICGEDINSPRQSFVCAKLQLSEYYPLVNAAWALIGHQLLTNADPGQGFFSPWAAARFPRLAERIAAFAAAGRKQEVVAYEE